MACFPVVTVIDPPSLRSSRPHQSTDEHERCILKERSLGACPQCTRPVCVWHTVQKFEIIAEIMAPIDQPHLYTDAGIGTANLLGLLHTARCCMKTIGCISGLRTIEHG